MLQLQVVGVDAASIFSCLLYKGRAAGRACVDSGLFNARGRGLVDSTSRQEHRGTGRVESGRGLGGVETREEWERFGWMRLGQVYNATGLSC